MPLRRLFVAFCLLLACAVGTPVAALAQTSADGGGVSADGVIVPPSAGNDFPSTPEATAVTTTPTAPATDDAQPITVAPGGTAATTPVAAAATPTPPPYLTPGAYANVQPVSGVADLKDPDIPFEPVRLAALLVALLAVLAISSAVLIRTLGLRTAVRPPVATAPGGRVSRARDRVVLLADDVRDFLRHSR